MQKFCEIRSSQDTPRTHQGEGRRNLCAAKSTGELIDVRVCCGDGHIEAEHLKYEVLHAQDVRHFVRVVGDVRELTNLGRVDLFVFSEDRIENIYYEM